MRNQGEELSTEENRKLEDAWNPPLIIPKPASFTAANDNHTKKRSDI
jgi:hypothetical protein